MRRSLALIALLFLLSGCAAETHYRNYRNPSAGQAEFDRDWYECKRENTHPSTFVAGGIATSGAEVDYQMAQSCMNARGWRLVKEQEGPKPTSGSDSGFSNPSARPAVITTPTSDPSWVNRQRILDESKNGQRLKSELRVYVAERQKQIDAMESKLKAMEQRLTAQSINPREDEGFKRELEDYQLQMKKLNAQVQSRKALAQGEFNAEIDRAVAQVIRQGFQGQDPNLLVIQILDRE